MVQLRQRLQFLEGTLCSRHPMTSKGRIFCGKVRCAVRFGRVPASVLGSRSKASSKLEKGPGRTIEHRENFPTSLNPEDQAMIDPICGISVDPERAAGSYTYNGQTYYF